MKPRQSLFVLDASVDVTGALVAANRAARLLKDEVRPILVLPAGSKVAREAVDGFSEVLRLPMVQLRKSWRSLLLYFPSLIRCSLRLRREMRARSCQHLQVNDFYLMHSAILRLLGFRGRIVTWIRIDPSRFGHLGRAWLWAARHSSDRLVAVSRFIQGKLPPGIETALIYDAFTPPAVSATMPPAAVTTRKLIFVGNYIPGKGQEHALEAFERIASRFPEARLLFVGSDMGLAKNASYRSELEMRAATGAARHQIRFSGQLLDLAPVYQGAFAALNFSASESFSLTCQEASGYGLPVITTRSGGPEEIVDDGETGFLVDVGDVAAMADRIAWLLADPSRAAAMGECGRAVVARRFAPDETKRDLIEALELDRKQQAAGTAASRS